MTTTHRRHPFTASALVAVAGLAAVVAPAAACGDDADETTDDTSEIVSRHQVSGGPAAQAGTSDGCEAFCEKANECATAAGRPVPPEARDCAASCEEGGIHRQAPEPILACAEAQCGGEFEDCTRRALLNHMRDQDIAIFPPICQGLCEKAAWCHRRANLPLGPGEDACEAACEPGGAFADLPEDEMNCVHFPCGGPFTTCRREGGASGPPQPRQPSRGPTGGPSAAGDGPQGGPGAAPQPSPVEVPPTSGANSP